MRVLLKIFSLLIVVGFVFLSISYAKKSMVGERLSVAEAETRWGVTTFDFEGFKNGSVQLRAKMAADILKKKSFVGSSVDDVEKVLGRHDAHFKNDFIPAYALNEGWKTDEDTWQIVFLPNREMKIVDVFINKNCCKKWDLSNNRGLNVEKAIVAEKD